MSSSSASGASGSKRGLGGRGEGQRGPRGRLVGCGDLERRGGESGCERKPGVVGRIVGADDWVVCESLENPEEREAGRMAGGGSSVIVVVVNISKLT